MTWTAFYYRRVVSFQRALRLVFLAALWPEKILPHQGRQKLVIRQQQPGGTNILVRCYLIVRSYCRLLYSLTVFLALDSKDCEGLHAVVGPWGHVQPIMNYGWA
jgi:hypothetical protein